MEIVLGILGVAFVCFIGFVALIGFGARKAVKSYTSRGATFEAPAYRHLSVEAGATAAEVCAVLEPFKKADGVGPRAARLAAQLVDAQRKHNQLQGVASARYTRSGLSLDAVTEVISSAEGILDKVLHNSCLLANGIQTFDVANYHALRQQRRVSTFKRNAAQDPMQEQRLSEMEQRLSALDEGLQENESALLEFDRLAANLSWLETEEMQQRYASPTAPAGAPSAAAGAATAGAAPAGVPVATPVPSAVDQELERLSRGDSGSGSSV